jgi:chromosome segregation ATPase
VVPNFLNLLLTQCFQEGVGDLPASPMSPRPQSLRKRQSSHILDLQSRVEQLQSDNRSLHDARSQAEQAALDAASTRDAHANTIRNAEQAVAERDVNIREKDEHIRELRENVESLQNEVDRLAQENAQLTEENHGIASSAQEYTNLKSEHETTHKRWQDALIAIAALKAQHTHMNGKMESMVREEISKATVDQEREIERLQSELDASMEQVKALQQQLLSSKQSNESFLALRDEDYFDAACQQLCQHVQQWVLRFSKFSDNKLCRLSSEIKDDTIINRLDDAILDGSDVDDMLRDRVKRRDVFMSIVMSLLWEHIFTRYLFGLDQSQRQKLKSVEKQLMEIGMYRSANIIEIR